MKSSVKDISEYVWSKQIVLTTALSKKNLVDLYLNVENDFSEKTPLGKLIKTFRQSPSNMLLFSNSILFFWNSLLLKFLVMILYNSFNWYGKFW